MKAHALQPTSESGLAKKQKAESHTVSISNWSIQPVSAISRPVIQRQSACPCGGGCPACQAKSNDLKISQPIDPAEIEADQIADKVMRMPEPDRIQTKQNLQTFVPMIQTKSTGGGRGARVNNAIGSRINSYHGDGINLDGNTRSFMESRFGVDLSSVRIHTGSEAAGLNREFNARAFTVGKDIYFDEGRYQPDTESGKRLLAHELAHVRQQGDGLSPAIQRACSDENFCTPYPTDEEAESAEWWVRNTYFRMEGFETFGPEVKALYDSYLSRSPGDSLNPVVIDNEGSYIVRSFQSSWDTKNDHDAVIDIVGDRLSRAPVGSLRDDVQTHMSLANFLSQSEMDNRPINYSNPFSVAGHIAGGLGSSDAGDDYRKITHGSVTLERVPLTPSTGYTKVDATLFYEVFDSIDFCPGDCGSPAEQLVTVPMSRLEASGRAYDVPFKVIFKSEERTKRFWF